MSPQGSRPTLSRSIRGLAALVTGAAGGMGEATARLFAAEGARVALVDIKRAEVEAVVRDIAGDDGAARAYACDLSDAAAVARVVEDAAAHWGGLDILVNNAGLSVHCPIDAPDYDERFALAVAVMLTAQQRAIRAALPHLRRSASQRLVNIYSPEALGATAGFSAYSAAKAGVVGLTRSLAV